MIARLVGEIIEVQPLHIVIMVGGVGYRVSVTSSSGFALGTQATLHTHLAVRENAQDLYGFTAPDALSMFEHLIKLPKIGPKTAIQILSQADITTIKKAVQTNDPVYLSKMSGIGKKSAEKIVMGLTDVFGDEIFGGETRGNQQDSDILDALMTLGYSQRDALTAVQKIPTDITDTNMRIKYALKTISA
ncbi:Holliday junction branch migration protein RuvA [Candidatus Kaiserbacteria bacterium]|nr:MAG: Holliday junction branch migration protein RuvA [Candidatus Kaiserbacteria bacterium]